jgi:hypothetical protein
MSGFRASVLTLYPEMFPGPLGVSLAGRALESGTWSLETVQIRDFATDRHRSVDDTPAGGGAGMVMRADILARAIDHASPEGDDPPAPADEPARQTADPGTRAPAGRWAGRGDPVRAFRGCRPACDRGAAARGGLDRRLHCCRAARSPPSCCSTPPCGSCPASWATPSPARTRVLKTACWNTRITPGPPNSRGGRSRRC